MTNPRGARIGLLICLISAAAYYTHIAATFMADAWVYLVLGGLLAPLGMLHGVCLWLGLGLV